MSIDTFYPWMTGAYQSAARELEITRDHTRDITPDVERMMKAAYTYHLNVQMHGSDATEALDAQESMLEVMQSVAGLMENHQRRERAAEQMVQRHRELQAKYDAHTAEVEARVKEALS